MIQIIAEDPSVFLSNSIPIPPQEYTLSPKVCQISLQDGVPI